MKNMNFDNNDDVGSYLHYIREKRIEQAHEARNKQSNGVVPVVLVDNSHLDKRPQKAATARHTLGRKAYILFMYCLGGLMFEIPDLFDWFFGL